MSHSLSATIFKGLTWQSLQRAIAKSFSIFRIIIVARLLTPGQVGEAGLALMAISLVDVFTETGFHQAAVQEDTDLHQLVSVMWITNVLRGIVLSVVLFFLSSFVTSFFNIQVTGLIVTACAIPLIKGFINPNIAALPRNLAFKRDSLYQLVSPIAENTAAMILVLAHPTPNSLMMAAVIGATIQTVSSYIIAPVNFGPISLSALKKLVGYGRWVTAGSIVSYLNDELDDFVVAKLLGPVYLGFYQTAYKISNLPTTQGASLIYQVFFPVYASIKKDKVKLQQITKKVTLISLAMSAILTGGLVVATPFVVPILLGPQWTPITPAVLLLAVFGFTRSNISVAAALFDALGKPSLVLVGNLIKLTALAILVVPLTLTYSYLGTSVCVSLAQLAVVPWYVNRYKKILPS